MINFGGLKWNIWEEMGQKNLQKLIKKHSIFCSCFTEYALHVCIIERLKPDIINVSFLCDCVSYLSLCLHVFIWTYLLLYWFLWWMFPFRETFYFWQYAFWQSNISSNTIMLWYAPVHVAFFHLLHFRKFQKKRKNEILVLGTDDVSFQSNYCRIAGTCKI